MRRRSSTPSLLTPQPRSPHPQPPVLVWAGRTNPSPVEHGPRGARLLAVCFVPRPQLPGHPAAGSLPWHDRPARPGSAGFGRGPGPPGLPGRAQSRPARPGRPARLGSGRYALLLPR